MNRPLRKICLIGLIGVCLILIVTRLVRLDKIPSGFFVDESSIAYNAYSILLTGKDEHRVLLPVFFEAFGEFKNPLLIYSQVPIIRLFGLSIFSSRLTSALWGLATVVVMYGTIKVLTQRKAAALVGVALLLASPWHWLLSRISFELITMPLFLVLAIYFLARFAQKFRPVYWYWFSLSLGVMFYSYTAARFLSPVLLISALIIFGKRLKIKTALISLGVLVVCLIPAGWWEYHHPGSLGARYQLLSVFPYHQGKEAYQEIISNYFKHFAPQFLFDSGDQVLRHSLAFHSLFMWSTIPLLLLGLRVVFFLLKRPFYRWLLMVLVLSPLPAAVTIQTPHALRSIGLLTTGLIIASLGFDWLYRKKWWLAVGWSGLFLLEVVWVYTYAFTEFPARSKVWYDQDALEALETAKQVPAPYYLSSELYPGTYATWLFVRQFPPALYQQTGLSDTIMIDPRQSWEMVPGTYVWDGKTCAQLPSNFTRTAHQIMSNPGTCVYVVP